MTDISVLRVRVSGNDAQITTNEKPLPRAGASAAYRSAYIDLCREYMSRTGRRLNDYDQRLYDHYTVATNGEKR